MPTKLQFAETYPRAGGGDGGREAVLQALEKLPAGTTRAEIENARYRALAPFPAAKKAGADADLYISYVSGYIKELGNEESGEWDLGNWFNRRDLAAKLKSNLRPLMIQKLVDKTMDTRYTISLRTGLRAARPSAHPSDPRVNRSIKAGGRVCLSLPRPFATRSLKC